MVASAQRIQDLITEDDVSDCLNGLRRLVNAQTSVRVSAPGAAKGFTYAMIDDGATQLLAIRTILEFKFGKPTQKLQVSGRVGHLHASTDQLLEAVRTKFAVTSGIVGQYLPEGTKMAEVAESEQVVPID